MGKRIYLDTNHWIKLLSIQQGKEENELLKKIFFAIKKLTIDAAAGFTIEATETRLSASSSLGIKKIKNWKVAVNAIINAINRKSILLSSFSGTVSGEVI